MPPPGSCCWGWNVVRGGGGLSDLSFIHFPCKCPFGKLSASGREVVKGFFADKVVTPKVVEGSVSDRSTQMEIFGRRQVRYLLALFLRGEIFVPPEDLCYLSCISSLPCFYYLNFDNLALSMVPQTIPMEQSFFLGFSHKIQNKSQECKLYLGLLYRQNLASKY